MCEVKESKGLIWKPEGYDKHVLDGNKVMRAFNIKQKEIMLRCWIMPLSLDKSLILDKLLNILEPQFSHLYSRYGSDIFHIGLSWGMKERFFLVISTMRNTQY